MKLLFIGFLCSLSLSLAAQISLDHNYSGQVNIAHLEFQDDKYAALDSPNRQCRLYNEDHSLYKTVNIPVQSGVTITSLQYVTDGLFDTDQLIEMACTYYIISGSSVLYESIILNENGQTLLTISGAGAGFVDYINDSWMYIAWVYGSSSQGISSSKVYNLPGHPAITSLISKPGYALAKPNPNPAREFINLHYKLNPGNNGVMKIFNSAGSLMKENQLGPDFDYIRVNVDDLSPGAYFYHVEGGIGSGSFIVN